MKIIEAMQIPGFWTELFPAIFLSVLVFLALVVLFIVFVASPIMVALLRVLLP